MPNEKQNRARIRATHCLETINLATGKLYQSDFPVEPDFIRLLADLMTLAEQWELGFQSLLDSAGEIQRSEAKPFTVHKSFDEKTWYLVDRFETQAEAMVVAEAAGSSVIMRVRKDG